MDVWWNNQPFPVSNGLESSSNWEPTIEKFVGCFGDTIGIHEGPTHHDRRKTPPRTDSNPSAVRIDFVVRDDANLRNGESWDSWTFLGTDTPPKTNERPLKKGQFPVRNTSCNHWFSGDMLVFRGVPLRYSTILDQHLEYGLKLYAQLVLGTCCCLAILLLSCNPGVNLHALGKIELQMNLNTWKIQFHSSICWSWL